MAKRYKITEEFCDGCKCLYPPYKTKPFPNPPPECRLILTPKRLYNYGQYPSVPKPAWCPKE